MLTAGHAAQDDVEAEGAPTVDEEPLRPGLAVTYEAEFAHQTDYGASPTDFELGLTPPEAGP